MRGEPLCLLSSFRFHKFKYYNMLQARLLQRSSIALEMGDAIKPGGPHVSFEYQQFRKLS
jgi:hypothetical protein